MGSVIDGVERRGIEKGKIEIILELLRANQPIEFISKITKFSKEKIAEIGLKDGIRVNQ